MNRVRYFIANHASSFRLLPGSAPVAQPWFGINPVWNNALDQQAIGVSIQFGRRGFAIHRRLV